MKLQREDIHPLQDTCPYLQYVRLAICRFHGSIKHPFDGFHGEEMIVAGICIADRATQIAGIGDFNQGDAVFLPVVRAESAVERASALFQGLGRFRRAILALGMVPARHFPFFLCAFCGLLWLFSPLSFLTH